MVQTDHSILRVFKELMLRCFRRVIIDFKLELIIVELELIIGLFGFVLESNFG